MFWELLSLWHSNYRDWKWYELTFVKKVNDKFISFASWQCWVNWAKLVSNEMCWHIKANVFQQIQYLQVKSRKETSSAYISKKIPLHFYRDIIYLEQELHTIFSFFSGSPFGLRVDDWVARACLPPGCTPDFGLPPDTGGGGLARPFCGILGRDGVVEAEFLL